MIAKSWMKKLVVCGRSKTKTKPAELFSIWGFPPEQKNLHPAPFPIELPTRAIFSVVDDIKGLVIDPYSGSGTTLVAAKLLGHDYIGIEISKEYADSSEIRLMNCENERSSVLLETGKHTVSQTFSERKANGAWAGKFRPDYDANRQQIPLKLLEPKTRYTKKIVKVSSRKGATRA